MKTEKLFTGIPIGTIEYVIAHWAWRQKRGKKHPSVCLNGQVNPRESLRVAQLLSGEGKAIQTYDDPEDLAHGEEWQRKCSLCFYRDGHPNPTKDCQIISKKHPKEIFGFKKNDYLPQEIDGKQLGHYCPYFLPFTAD